jgi:hypothetical protein
METAIIGTWSAVIGEFFQTHVRATADDVLCKLNGTSANA